MLTCNKVVFLNFLKLNKLRGQMKKLPTNVKRLKIKSSHFAQNFRLIFPVKKRSLNRIIFLKEPRKSENPLRKYSIIYHEVYMFVILHVANTWLNQTTNKVKLSLLSYQPFLFPKAMQMLVFCHISRLVSLLITCYFTALCGYLKDWASPLPSQQ